MSLFIYHIVGGKVLSNVGVVSKEEADRMYGKDYVWAPPEENGDLDKQGWLYDAVSGTISPPPEPFPESITPRQLKEYLIEHDLIDNVKAVLNAVTPEKNKLIVLNWWAEASEFRRDHPLVRQIAQALSLSSAQVDQIWLAASKL